MRPRRLACTAVVRPLTTRTAKLPHARYDSLPPAARTTIATVMTMPAIVSTTYWSARPIAILYGGVSSGSYWIAC